MFINIIGINNTLSLLLLLFHKPVSISLNHINSKFKRPQTGKKEKQREREREREKGGGGPFKCFYVLKGLLHRMKRGWCPNDPGATEHR